MVFLELNDFIEDVEENISQQIDLEPPVQNVVQVEVEVQNQVVPHIEGFPVPALVDLIGEEIPIDQLMGLENEPQMAEQEAEEEDFDPDHLVGLGEDGYPDINNGGGLQLQANPVEDNLLALADELHMDELMQMQ